MVVYNGYTIFAIAAAVVAGMSIQSLFHHGASSLLAGALGALTFDFVTRMRNRTDEVPLLSPEAGGHFWFVPVWIVAAIIAAAGGLIWLGWL